MGITYPPNTIISRHAVRDEVGRLLAGCTVDGCTACIERRHQWEWDLAYLSEILSGKKYPPHDNDCLDCRLVRLQREKALQEDYLYDHVIAQVRLLIAERDRAREGVTGITERASLV